MGQRTRTVSVMVAGMIAGSLLVTPAAAHVGTAIQRLSNRPIRALSTQLFDTRTQGGALVTPDDLGDYCGRSAANPRSYPSGPCTDVRHLNIAEGYGITASLSLTLGADGLPIASYWSPNTGRELRTAQCDNPTCTAGINISQAEANPGDPNLNLVGVETSIAIGADGLPVIAHWDEHDGDLIVTHCGNAACSFGNQSTTAVEGSGAQLGSLPSIAIGSDKLPVMTYFDDTANVLLLTRCNDVACAGQDESLTTVDTGTDGPSSITIGVDGLPIISYAKGGLLKTAHCGNAACDSGNVMHTLDAGGGAGRSSITIGLDGNPVMSYVVGGFPGYHVKVAHCGNASCTSGNTTKTIGPGGTDTAIAIGFNGTPYLSYFLETTQFVADTYLKVVHCGNATCSSGNVTKTLGPIYAGSHTDLVVGIDGRPLVAYWQQFGTLVFVRPKI
ncbi:MAG: hypothetical protein ACJ77A_15705 [Actinomycetota bacterium]